MNDITGIIGAMDCEVQDLCSLLQEKEEVKVGNLVFNKGILNGKQVVVVKSGVGKVHAALCAQILIMKFNVTRVINTGIAGATGKGLVVMDFVVSTEAVYHDFDITVFGYKPGEVPGAGQFYKADEKLADKTVKAFNSLDFAKNNKIIKGRVASGDQFISDKEVKAKIINTFSPDCVEMEGAAIAHTCSLYNIPFVVIRCMSDCADEGAVYEFNEDRCASMCAQLTAKLVKEL